jgi:hypothetical protein
LQLAIGEELLLISHNLFEDKNCFCEIKKKVKMDRIAECFKGEKIFLTGGDLLLFL